MVVVVVVVVVVVAVVVVVVAGVVVVVAGVVVVVVVAVAVVVVVVVAVVEVVVVVVVVVAVVVPPLPPPPSEHYNARHLYNPQALLFLHVCKPRHIQGCASVPFGSIFTHADLAQDASCLSVHGGSADFSDLHNDRLFRRRRNGQWS